MFKKVTDNELLKIIMLTYLSFLLIGRGVFFLSMDYSTMIDSDFYNAIDSNTSLTLIGILPIVSGILILTTAFSNTTQSHLLFLFANIIAVIVYFVFSEAGMQHGLNWWTPFSNALNLSVHVILILWSVFVTWTKKKTT
ncbi:hypothetical protein [Nosocomiicoccus ampullae]|uniref:hypothetical protein n=1 Tax=Nosocomiicoccus ampullae TaxID=489910 RepID=UPI001C5D0871|nr:hypothetical protein [Nosocomiicoccus ampullae]QYA47943.1 hypothetical protein KPF52_05660 [Nosocomiicoccus ampullae]